MEMEKEMKNREFFCLCFPSTSFLVPSNIIGQKCLNSVILEIGDAQDSVLVYNPVDSWASVDPT